MKYTITNGGYVNGRPNQIGNNSVSTENRIEYIFTVADFTTNTTPEYKDPEGDPMAYVWIGSLPDTGKLQVNGVDIQEGSIVNSSNISTGNFKYIPDDIDAYYSAAFSFDVADTGSNTVSGLLSRAAGTMLINVSEKENLPPSSVGDGSVLVDYSESHTFTKDDFTSLTIPTYSDPEGDEPYKLKILSLPYTDSFAGLKYNGSAVSINQEILFSDIEAGYLVYDSGLPPVSGRDTDFDFSISDVGSKNFTS